MKSTNSRNGNGRPQVAPEQGATILIVDDSDLQRASARMALEARGFQTIEARDGSQGVELARTAHPDLILMDVTMPMLDGLSAARMIREGSGTEREIPIVFLSGHGFDSDRTRALAAGGDEYLVKPVATRALLTAVKKWLGRVHLAGKSVPLQTT